MFRIGERIIFIDDESLNKMYPIIGKEDLKIGTVYIVNNIYDTDTRLGTDSLENNIMISIIDLNNNLLGVWYCSRFKSLKEYRKLKLNKILNDNRLP